MDYGYNVLGERTSQTTALGTQTVGLPTNFLYNALGRLETIDYPQGDGEANIDTHFSYGPTDLRMSMTDGVGATTWTYTALGLVKTVEDPSQNVVEYGYDGLGNRNKLIYPDQKTVTYGYDKLNRLETVTDWNNQITSYTYSSTQTGFTRQIHRHNGVVSTDTLDPVGRLVDRVHAKESTTLASYHYEYEPAGDRWQATERMLGYPNFLPVILNPESGGEKSIDGMEKAYPAPSEGEPLPLEKGTPEEDAYPVPETTKQSSSLLEALVDFFTWLLSPRDTVQAAAPAQAVPLPLQENAPLESYVLTGPVETTYLYDNLHRLTYATDNIGNTYAYAYDANGNRVSEQAPGGSPVISVYDQANRLTNVGGAPYAWDASGNLTNDGTHQYIYDQANRLKEVKNLNGDSLATYTYSGLGDRLTENNTQFVLDLNAGLTQVLQDGAYTYLYGSERLMQQSQASTGYFLGDALGSVRQLVDETGAVTLTKSYQPYGEELSSMGMGSTNYGYTSEWESQDLIFLRARYYSPYLGLLIQPDPLKHSPFFPQDWNQYVYARSNPMKYNDPSGKYAKCNGVPDCGLNDDVGSNEGWLNSYFMNLPYPYAKMPSEMTLSESGIQHLEFWEYKENQLYNDGNSWGDPLRYNTEGRGTGNCTIGYGHLIHYGQCDGSEGDLLQGISDYQAKMYLDNDVKRPQVYVQELVKVRLTQYQFNVLVSLIFNWGVDNFRNSFHLRYLNYGLYVDTANRLRNEPVYRRGGKSPEPGLVNRRAAEASLFLKTFDSVIPPTGRFRDCRGWHMPF